MNKFAGLPQIKYEVKFVKAFMQDNFEKSKPKSGNLKEENYQQS